MRVRVRHETLYRYDRPASLGPHVVRLRPANHAKARLLSYNLAVEPGCESRWQHDPWGNRIARLTFPKDSRTSSLRLVVDAAFDVRPVNPFDFYIDDRCKTVPFDYPADLGRDLDRYLEPPAQGERFRAFLKDVPQEGETVDWLVRLVRLVAGRVRYIIRNDPGIQTSEETLEVGSGSCRDSARLLVDALRTRGLAARFVSGYLVQLTDEGIIPDMAKGVSRDVVDLHAWAEVYVPGGGWIGLDGTSGLLCGEGHVPLASASEPEHAAPVTGTADVAAARFEFSMEIERLGHEPRPRRPYTEEEWDALLAAGEAVDESLRARSVRLTAGGEPTWTSREHPAAPEWNHEALGPTKWTQGARLAAELARRAASGVLGMHRMGKWYPGESLPRWELELIWRPDGAAIWRDAARLDFTTAAAGTGTRAERTIDDAERFAEHLARRLDVSATAEPGFEEPWYFLREEAGLPEDVDPLEADLDDPEERRRLARVFERGLSRPVGFALPLRRDPITGETWESSPWSFRRGRMFLIPGDSPMGLRLPLGSLGGEAELTPEADTTRAQGPLRFDPSHAPSRLLASRRHEALSRGAVPQRAGGAGEVIRTSLCVEPRDGVLHVFLPPLLECEHFLELVAAVEDTAAALDLSVRVEGYGPPADPRLRSLSVTPDPGVIEVNLPPTETFREYVNLLEISSDAANHAGLSTEKYQIDGREVGSGGGNHLTLGGPTTVESPFITRPDILGSLLRYTQNHPSLSYLFTGLFVGPTSQAPRIDEARHDALAELELALSQIPPPGSEPQPWLIDRLLRNLVVDVEGNTHRTEISIDKLYSPDSLSGRRGLIELRAFEMPPHERMAAAQMLLVRSLVAMFAREPCTNPLVRWGTALHDRFMLPHAIWRDFEDVIRELHAAGLPIDAAWYRPFLDHRFPVMGTLQIEDLELELRAAMEPWPTLGEEPAGPTVSRYVDSSLERLQVTVRGITEGRHVVSVNGLELPLHPTGTSLERVAGVRFRAWQPPRCLQPNIPVHHPLHFDIVDTWGKRSLGACTYHVWHPEGRAFEAPPLTAFEAAARRAQRFTTEGHAPWPVRIRKTSPHPEHPYTLDLRRFPPASALDARGSGERPS